jgi:hypothetical protein
MVTMNQRLFFGILALVISDRQFVQADTIVSPEKIALYQLATAIKVYPILHNGQQVATWAQVGEVYNLANANKSLRGKPAHPLEDHYEFVAHPVPFPRYEGSAVVLVRTVPLQRAEGQAKFRYLIGRTKDGELTATRLSEEEVQAMFQQAKVPLPTPKPGLAAVEIEALPDLDGQTANDPGSREGADGRRPIPEPSPSALPVIPKVSSPPPALGTPPSAPLTEHKAPAWLWVFGFAVLIVLAARVLKRRPS